MAKKKKITVLDIQHCADLNHDQVVRTLLKLGKSHPNPNNVFGTGEFYDSEGHSQYVIYESDEEQSIWDVCKVANIGLDDDMKDF